MAGTNAFWVTTGIPSRHMAVADTCVGCHMTLHPDSITPAITNHTFRADGTICKSCHGTLVNLEALEGEFTLLAGNALANFDAKVKANLGATFYWKTSNPTSGGTPAYKVVGIAKVAVASATPAGRSGVTYTFVTPIADPWGGAALASISASTLVISNTGTPGDGPDAVIGPPTFATKGVIAKANWNLYIASGAVAGSPVNMIHNPSFAFQVVNATNANLINPGTQPY